MHFGTLSQGHLCGDVSTATESVQPESSAGRKICAYQGAVPMMPAQSNGASSVSV
jgi:hypothetical protein